MYDNTAPDSTAGAYAVSLFFVQVTRFQGQQVGYEEWHLVDSVICPDYGIVFPASVEDCNGDDAAYEDIKHGGKDEEYKEGIFSFDIVLYVIKHEDKKNLKKTIANHHSQIVGEFLKSQNVSPQLSTNTSMVSIAGAKGRDEGPDSSDEVAIEATKGNGEGNYDKSGLDVNIRGGFRLILVPIKAKIETNSTNYCIFRIIIIKCLSETNREVSAESESQGKSDKTDLEHFCVSETIGDKTSMCKLNEEESEHDV